MELGGGLIKYQRFNRPKTGDPCYTLDMSSHDELFGIYLNYDPKRITDVMITGLVQTSTFTSTSILDFASQMDVSKILINWTIDQGKCYALNRNQTIGQLEDFFASDSLFIKWFDERTMEWGFDRLAFDRMQFHVDGLSPSILYVFEGTGTFNSTHTIQEHLDTYR